MRVTLAALSLATMVAACGEEPTTPGHGPGPLPPSLPLLNIASDPSNPAGSAASGPSGLLSAHSIVEPTAYVGMAPATVGSARAVHIENLRTGFILDTAVVNGGFDPVPLPALEGDTLTISITRTVGDVDRRMTIVPERRRPLIIRTNPPAGRTEVSLNESIRIVFSEPIAPITLDPAHIKVVTGGVAIPGAVRAVDGSAVAVEFVPDAPLEPGRHYELILSDALTDFDGDPIEGRLTSTFTTRLPAPKPPIPPPEPGPSCGTDCWSTLASLPTPRIRPSGAAAKGKWYVMGGTHCTPWCNTPVLEVDAYDASAGEWSRSTDLPTGRQDPAVAAVNGLLYVIGGYLWQTGGGPYQVFNNVEVLDPATNSWTPKAPLPTPRFGLAVGVIDGILYAVGGATTAEGGNTFATPTGVVEAYDPATDTWSSRAPIPAKGYGMFAGVINGKLYVAGGQNSPGASTFEYDPATDRWTPRAPAPFASDEGCSAVINNRLYAFAWTGSFSYDPVTDSWTSVASSPDYCSGAVGVINGAVYMTAGDNGDVPEPSQVLRYQP